MTHSKGFEVLFVIDARVLGRLDDFCFQRRFSSRSDAIRRLLDWSLDYAGPGMEPSTSLRQNQTASSDRNKLDARSQTTQPLAYGAKELAKALSIGKTTAWGLMASGEIRSIKIGSRRLAPASEVHSYLKRKLDEGW